MSCFKSKTFILSASNEEHKKPVMDKAEATALALGIAKLMKIKQPSSSSSETTTAQEDRESSGEIVSKHLDADFSCFLCRKKCRSRARFLLHFKRHFNKANRNLSCWKPDNSLSSSDEEDDDDEEKDERIKKKEDDLQIHLRGLSSLTECSNTSRHRRASRPPRNQGNGKRKLKHVQDHDGDSGCHSADDGGSSSNGELTSDCCPGDSEESSDDSDSQVKKSKQLEKCFARSRIKAANKSSKDLKHHEHRLSLAEKQLDNNDTESLVCMTCLKRFSNCQNLRRHLRLHIARDSIKPDFESLEDGGERVETTVETPDDNDNPDLPNKDNAKGQAQHGKNHKGGRFLCDWCPLRFDNRSAARIHEATHKGQEPRCYVCSKQYADRYSLRYHLRTHGIGRQIRCEYCSKAFSKPSRLAAHVRSHHKNIRDFACPSCDKAFKTRVHLNNHFRQHSGEKPFECPVCHEKFRHKASMISHARKHDGQRPYCCEICGKTFREPSTLKAHSRVHTGDKPYTCLDCGKSFTQRAGLNYHRKASHEGLRPHVCRLCPFATVKAASLTAHYRNIHQQQHSDPKVTSEASSSATQVASMSLVTAEENTCQAQTPLPSFDNLKTSNSNISPTASPAPLTPPSSSSPSSSSTSSACLEDFLPPDSGNPSSNSGTGGVSGGGFLLPSLSVSELASHLEYGTYDYQNYRQHMYGGQEQVLPHQHLMHHQQEHHHQQQHQWFSYASSQQHHEMINGTGSSNNNHSNSPAYANYGGGGGQANSSSGGGAGGSNANYPYFNPGANGSANGSANGNGQDYMSFSGGNNYDTAYSHPSYCI